MYELQSYILQSIVSLGINNSYKQENKIPNHACLTVEVLADTLSAISTSYITTPNVAATDV